MEGRKHIHKQMRKAMYEPKYGVTPILLESLDTKHKTSMDFSKSKVETHEDDWRVTPRELLSLGRVGQSLGYCLEAWRAEPQSLLDPRSYQRKGWISGR